jgi:lysophospholipid acyltransferase (LPLAT)-like uncharacterized protein
MALSPLISRHILPFTLKLLYASLRLSVTPLSLKIQLTDKGTIFTFWHGKMMTGWLLARALFPSQKRVAVVSLSEDGTILSDTLEQLDFTLIRGSSSRGGDEVKLAMEGALQQKNIIILTPDGPRGPVNQFKYGTLRIASSNNYPLIFAEIKYENAWKLKSWDQFEIPKPFSKTVVQLHRIDLPEFESEEALRIFTKKLSDRFGHA